MARGYVRWLEVRASRCWSGRITDRVGHSEADGVGEWSFVVDHDGHGGATGLSLRARDRTRCGSVSATSLRQRLAFNSSLLPMSTIRSAHPAATKSCRPAHRRGAAMSFLSIPGMPPNALIKTMGSGSAGDRRVLLNASQA
jgi:hypothetical protein